MGYRLLALDIDGTIRNKQNKISTITREAIITLQRNGITAVIVSGRPVYGMIETAKELQLDLYGGYILAFNGGVMMNCKTKEIVSNHKLPVGYASYFLEFAKSYECDMLSYDEEFLVTNNIKNPYVCHEARVNKMKMKETKDFSDYNNYELNKCIIAGNPDIIKEVEKEGEKFFSDKVGVYRSEPFFLEVMPYGVDKGSSLEMLVNILGYSREEIMACGDGYNDITMLQYAGLGIAMENAQQSVKEAADFVTKSCDEDGVVYAINKFGLLK